MTVETYKRSYLEEWIDGNAVNGFELARTSDPCEDPNNHDIGLLNNLFEVSIVALQGVYQTVIRSAVNDQSWEDQQIHSLRLCLENFYLWGQSACPLQRVLTKSQGLYDTILECLYNIGTLLSKLFPFCR